MQDNPATLKKGRRLGIPYSIRSLIPRMKGLILFEYYPILNPTWFALIEKVMLKQKFFAGNKEKTENALCN